MGRSLVETLIGAVVLVVAGGFLFFAYEVGGVKTVEGYPITARFDRVDGLTEGSDVRLSGIKVGTVTKEVLDPQTYLAVVTMNIKSDVKLPRDTSAQITSEGLLGNKYLSLTPGADEAMLKPDGEIQHTQGSIDLISLVGRFIFGQAGGEEKGGQKKKGAGSLAQ